jgi:hypothetical protein
MAAATAVPGDLSSSTGIERYLRSREELANQVAPYCGWRSAATAVKAWRELRAAKPIGAPGLGERVQLQESLLERFERLNGRPLAAACPTSCSCRGQTTTANPEEASCG